jgi:hypothetical protein
MGHGFIGPEDRLCMRDMDRFQGKPHTFATTPNKPATVLKLCTVEQHQAAAGFLGNRAVDGSP